jgi:hypothetical protein
MRIAALLSALALVMLIVGCGDDEPTGPGPTVSAPTNLDVQVAGADSLSIRLTWTAPSQTVDGYIVTIPGGSVDTTTNTYYEHTPTSLGAYSVKAYLGGNSSSTLDTTTALHSETNEGPIYWLQDPDPGHPSGYGWDASGNGATYSASSANRDYIDLILDADEDLRSPADTFGSSWHTTGIAYNASWTYSGMTVAPLSGYLTWQSPVVNGVYVLWLEAGGQYLKLEITEHNTSTHSIRFNFGFQRIAGFRRLG